MKKWLGAAGIIALGLALTACSTTKSGSSSASSDKTINVTSAGSLTTLDSVLYDDVYSSDNIGQIIEGLYKVNKKNEPILGIAKAEPKVSSDGLTYTYTLRDTKWSNGDSVTANDFVYAYQKVVDPSSGSQNANSMEVFKNGAKIAKGELKPTDLGVKALDEHTLQLTLERPVPYLAKLLTGTRFLPQDEKYAKEKGKKYGTSSDTVVANGPFTISGWDGTNEKWTLKKNKNYWDAKSVKLNQVKVSVVKETSTGVNLFDAGETDFTVLADDFAKEKKTSDQYHSVSKSLVGYIGFNFKRETTANVHVRKAIALAYNKKSFTSNILSDGSTPLNGLVANDYAKDPKTNKEFREENGDLLAYNLKEAKKEWALAKKDLGKDKIELTLLSADTSAAKQTVEFLQGELQQNLDGLTVKVQSVPIGQRLKLNRSGDFDFFFGTWTPDYADPIDFLQPYITNGGLNFGGYSSTKYDALIDKALNADANNTNQRWQDLLAAEKVGIGEDVAVAPVYQGSISYLQSDKVKDIQTLPFGRSVSYAYAYKTK